MKKGTALTLVLVIMIIVGIGSTAILQAIISYANMRKANVDRIKAQYLSEAGVQYGICQLRQGNTSSPVTITQAEKSIVITKTQQPDGSYVVSATTQY